MMQASPQAQDPAASDSPISFSSSSNSSMSVEGGDDNSAGNEMRRVTFSDGTCIPQQLIEWALPTDSSSVRENDEDDFQQQQVLPRATSELLSFDAILRDTAAPRRRKTTGDNIGDKRYSTRTRLSVAHRNDKNDTDSNLTFKEFRRELDVLKRSINVSEELNDELLDEYSFSDEGSYDETDDDKSCSQMKNTSSSSSMESMQQQAEPEHDDDDRPSLYARGTAMRSMRNISCKSAIIIDDERIKRRKQLAWLKSFYHTDPRWQICNFFDDLAYEGVGGIDESGRITNTSIHLPSIMRVFSRVGVFSVWRPTSKDAIKRMMTGEGTGKGMDIKGKSATRGKWSGFVPFLQIHKNEDKNKVGSMRADGRVRVFYPNERARDRAYMTLAMVRDNMLDINHRTQRFISMVEQKEATVLHEEMHKSSRNLSHTTMKTTIEDARRKLSKVVDYTEFKAALEAKHHNNMVDSALHKIDDYASARGCYGLDIPEKLFWEAYVMKADISREEGSEHDFGRPSMPEFQSMNMDSLRKSPKSGPRPVLWHAGCGKVGEDPPTDADANPLCPYGLLMAYEEVEDDDNNEQDEGGGGGKVTPVVSDFDCFLVGTRGVEYRDPLQEQELSILKWCVDEIGGVLDKNNDKDGGGGGEASWTRQWLDVKKKFAFDPRFQAPVPKMGYADPRSSAMMRGAVYSLRGNGAVRHGPECFNYSFPQDLDDKFLVISDTLPGLVPWKYVDINELKEILAEKIDDGFAFPLNPKWILCDEGWKDLYDKLLASEAPNVQDAMSVWYPTDVRDRIAAISSKHPNGLECSSDTARMRRTNRRGAFTMSQDDYHEYYSAELAVLQLERYKHSKRAVWKLRRSFETPMTKETKKTKEKKKQSKTFSFFSSVLVMLRIGKEVDTQNSALEIMKRKKPGGPVRRSTICSEHTTTSVHTTVSTISTSSAPTGEKDLYERRRSRKKSITAFIRKRLSFSSKKDKMERRSSM